MMDILKDYAFKAYQLYNSADPYLQPIRSMYWEAQAQLYPIVLPLLHKAAIFTQESPAIISVGVIILFLLITMQILNFVRRVMMWWTRFLMSLMFWGLIVLVIAVVAQRGVGRTVGDLYEWGVELSEVWWREYRRWEGYQNQAQYKGQMQGRGGPNPGVRAGSSWR